MLLACVQATLTLTTIHAPRAYNRQATAQRWGEVAALISGRTAKQCRERWCYNLDPALNKATWKGDEDETLISTQAAVGNRWARIAAMLPGRSENAVKTRFKSILRARKRTWCPEEDGLILAMSAETPRFARRRE